ncbi:hypothetical protein ACPFL9_19930 [Paenarthrobacter sp. NyZ202]|uniref:hypothetical protein n=1 Tax=Paenarthrobacter sp. NyZ202 TaxID=3402689 RepID=UPI003CF5DC9D
MEKSFDIELVNQDEYVVRWASEGQTGESVFRVTSDFLGESGLEGHDGQRIVEETSHYLAERQPVIDFPQTVDLEEIAAAYPDFVQALKTALEKR